VVVVVFESGEAKECGGFVEAGCGLAFAMSHELRMRYRTL